MTWPKLQVLLAGREAEHVGFKPAFLPRKEIAGYTVGIGNSGGALAFARRSKEMSALNNGLHDAQETCFQ